MNQEEFLALVDETLEEDAGTASMESNLDDLGWDSLANISFIAEVDTRHGVEIDAERLAKAESVADLFELLTEAIAAA